MRGGWSFLLLLVECVHTYSRHVESNVLKSPPHMQLWMCVCVEGVCVCVCVGVWFISRLRVVTTHCTSGRH